MPDTFDRTEGVGGYLRRLEHALGSLPPAERREIVAETESHLADRHRRGDLASPEAALGPPEEYARQFLDAADGPPAGAASRPRRFLNRVVWVFSVGLIAVAYALGVFFFASAVVKVLSPGQSGLWVRRAEDTVSWTLMMRGTPEGGEEVLGWWFLVIAASGAVLCFLAGTIVLRRLIGRGVHDWTPESRGNAMRVLVVLLMLPLAAGSGSGPLSAQSTASAPSQDASPTRVEIDAEGRLVYRGDISGEANERAMALFAAAAPRPTTLLISTPGGDVAAGLALGEWVHENGLDIEVGVACMSACANYVFPAGREKRLRRSSILVWHGGAWLRSMERRTDPSHRDYLPFVQGLREREARLYERLGVDNLMPVYGIDYAPRRGPVYHFLARLRGRSIIGFDYDLDDLAQMGVSDIVLLDGEWDWRAHHPDIASRVLRVALPADYELRMGRYGGTGGRVD